MAISIDELDDEFEPGFETQQETQEEEGGNQTEPDPNDDNQDGAEPEDGNDHCIDAFIYGSYYIYYAYGGAY